MKKLSLIILVLSSLTLLAQNNYEEKLNLAYSNAKKGIYYALSNIPEKRNKLEEELIFEDQIIARVKLSKEVEGVRIESTGIYECNEVTVKLYRSFDLLRKEGYLTENLTEN